MREQQRRGWLQANFCGLLDELINRLVHPIREMAHWHCFCYGGRVSCSPALPPWLVTPRLRRQIWQLPEVSFSVREYWLLLSRELELDAVRSLGSPS